MNNSNRIILDLRNGLSRQNAIETILKDNLVYEDHMTYLFAFDQNCYGHTIDQIVQASSLFGYNFVLSWYLKNNITNISIENNGVSRIYYPTYISIGGEEVVQNGKKVDLSKLQPGESILVSSTYALKQHEYPKLLCVRCLDGQTIPYHHVSHVDE